MTESNPLYLRALNQYRTDGLFSLLAASKNKFFPDFNNIIISKLSIHRNQLTSREKNKYPVWYYGSEMDVEVSPPILSNTPEEFEPYLGTHKISRQFVCELPDVKIFGKYGIAQTERGRFILEEMHNVGTVNYLLKESSDSTFKIAFDNIFTDRADVETLEYEAVLNLVPRHFGGPDYQYHGNYGHWLAEDLPRLRGYHRYQEATGRTPTILIRQDPPDWMTNTLRLLGFSSSDWAEWDGDSAVASRLVVPQLNNYHDMGVAFDPQGRKWVSKEMKQRIDMSNSVFPARIFTSRQGHGSREIVNYDEVKEVLEEFDITPIRPEELPLDDQIRLFDQADIIVGPFGANLTNIIFSEDPTVVEIFPSDFIRPVFYITANEQGLDYDYIVGEPESTINGNNIYVNIMELRKKLSNLII
jgi:hypothetical protein